MKETIINNYYQTGTKTILTETIKHPSRMQVLAYSKEA